MVRHGLKPIFTRFDDLAEVEDTLENNPHIKAIYLETLQPYTGLCRPPGSSKPRKSKGIITIIDNTFCTPYLQQPFNYGIDFIIHSSTKYQMGMAILYLVLFWVKILMMR